MWVLDNKDSIENRLKHFNKYCDFENIWKTLWPYKAPTCYLIFLFLIWTGTFYNSFKVLKQDIKWYGQTWTQHKLKNSHENAVTKHWDEMSGIGLGLGLCFQGHLKVRLWAQRMRDTSRGASGDSFHGYCKGVQVTAMAASCSPLKDQSVDRSRRDYMALGVFRNSGTEDNILSNYLCLVYENSKHFTS